jgi:hypothetical protein
LEPQDFSAVCKLKSFNKAGHMQAGYFIIAILGCADGSTTACTPVMTVPTHYSTEAECVAATRETLLKHTDFDFPSLFAQCRPAKPSTSADRDSDQKSKAETRRG